MCKAHSVLSSKRNVSTVHLSLDWRFQFRSRPIYKRWGCRWWFNKDSVSHSFPAPLPSPETHTHTHQHTKTPTVFLADLQQNGLSQLNGEGLVLLILFIINNLHLDDLPVKKQRERLALASAFHVINLSFFTLFLIIRVIVASMFGAVY